ncbi:efflux RND transporter periplasmic adaptor subunit [Limnoglobus roseus]|uniref:Efflux RND transporter periplasmic adaptor subunit n=1 Tax=Limnoglobus roseus TaxID=2598579 RepID=A0A5C1AEC9_9BACT|nr:efflux RND transporter periplasmic adaptor subunit [Limnoglobus roseus]QEL16386.1 efflux RND transporter periplasmic adaptor subunit [Limnoglobus roseus]
MRKFLLLASLAVAGGCNRSTPTATAPVPATAPVVTVVKPQRKTVQRVVEQPGTVQAFEEVTLFAKIPGYVRALSADPDKASHSEHDRLIDIGSRVKKDQILAELSVPELEEEFKQKEATARQYAAEVQQATKAHAAATAGVTAAKAQVAEAKAGLTRAQALYDRWQSEATRAAKLVTGGVIDAQTRDETVNQFKAAEAGKAEADAKVTSADAAVAKAQADAEKAIADVTTAEARLDVAKADVRRVDALRGYTRLKAPFDGIVTRRAVSAGDFTAADGKHSLFAVARIDPVRVVFQVPEADAGLVTAGQDVKLALQGLSPGGTGKVTRTSWSLDPGSRTLRVEVDLPNPEGKVRPGTYAKVRLTADVPPDWSLPAAAVGKANDEAVVYLVEDGKAVRVGVQLARGDAQTTQVLRFKRSGTTAWVDFTGTELIATPSASLSDGQPISVGP